MRSRLLQIGLALICGGVLAAQVASDALTRRVPSIETEVENPALHQLQPQGMQPKPLRSVFDGVVIDSVFGNSASQSILQVDYEEQDSEFPPLTLPGPINTPSLQPPTPRADTQPEPFVRELPTPITAPIFDAPSDKGSGPPSNESTIDNDPPKLSQPNKFPQDSAFPPLTLPPKNDAVPADTDSKDAEDPFNFQPIRERTDTKFTGQVDTSQPPIPEVVATPSPFQQEQLVEALSIPDNRDANPIDAVHDAKFAAIDRDEEQSLLLQAARNSLRLADKAAAIERFTEYLRLYPTDAEIRLEFAGVLSAHGRPEVGATQIRHLLQQFPDNLDVLRRYVDMQMQLNHYAEAEPVLDRLIQHAEYRLDAAVDLARVYANTNRRQAAAQIYEEILRQSATAEPKRMLQFAQLLLDIRRPTEALELLWELHGREPLSLPITRLLVLASARTGNLGSTFEYIGRMQSIEPENIKVRYEFALQLFSEGFYRESILIDQQILDFEPGNADSLVRSAVANLRLYEPLAARALLSGVNDDATNIPYLRAMASYHSQVGEHADAIAICRRVLSENPSDLKTRLVLGDVYLRAAQIDRSIDTFASIADSAREPGIEDGQQLRTDAVLSQARALAQKHLYDDALVLLESSDWPPEAHDGVLDTYVSVLTQARRYGQAVQHVREALADSLGNNGREIQLRSRLGLLLARNGEYASAIQELSVAAQMSDEPLPEAIYGKYQAYKMLGDRAGMQKAANEYLGPLATNAFLRVRVAELATEDCDCCFARQMLEPLDAICDTNPLIANRMGEACLSCASCEAAPNCAGYFQRALAESPANVQALLGIARTLARVKNYAEAYCYYQQAERYMSDDLDLKREIGRMIREWKGPEAATQIYNQALAMTTTDHLVNSAKRSPEMMAELEKEYTSRSNFSTVVATELAGKQLSGWKPLSAISVFEGVSAMEPHNQDSVFEIGQAYSQLNRTHCAIEQYQRLLCMNPCHREAQVALDRNQREISPQLHLFSKVRSQEGRQDLSTIDQFDLGGLLQFPIGDEDEFLQLGYTNSIYKPPGAPQLNGHIATGRIQWKPIWPLVLFSQLNYEIYNYGFKPRWNYDIGARFRHIENAELRLRLLQENVIQNRVAIRRDIHRNGVEIGQYWKPTQRFEVDTILRRWEYSDDNTSYEGGLHSGYQLTDGRDRLRLLIDFDWMTYREQAEFLIADDLDSITRPYFAPDVFWFLSAGFEHRHYFGCETFKAGNRHWVEGYLGGRVDSDGVAYASVRGEFLWDYHSRLSASGYFEYLTSETYENGEVGLKLVFRY